MAKIVWDSSGSKTYEIGLDRGVLYDDGVGIAWNGLTSATVSQQDGGNSPLYFNGIKTFDLINPGVMSVSLRAITYPKEFDKYNGVSEYGDGLLVSNQNTSTFGLCYRTYKANDATGLNNGYKIHILYNLTAVEDAIDHTTISSDFSPIEFGWTLTAKPEQVSNRRPTAYFVIDSTKMHATPLAEIESILYGTSSTSPRLPSVNEILDFLTVNILSKNDTIHVFEDETIQGEWKASGPSYYITNNTTTGIFTIDNADVIFLTADKYQISST